MLLLFDALLIHYGTSDIIDEKHHNICSSAQLITKMDNKRLGSNFMHDINNYQCNRII